MNRPQRRDVTAGTVTKVLLPVLYAGTSMRLLATLRASTDPAVREMAIALTAATAAASTLPPSVLDAFDDVLGDANYGRFLSQLGTVVAAGTAAGVMLRSSYPQAEAEPKVRVLRRGTLGSLLLMGAVFTRDRSVAAELQSPTDRIYHPTPALYWATFGVFMIGTAGETTRLAFRTSRLNSDVSLRVGLRCLGVGTMMLTGFYGQLVAAITARLLTSRGPAPVRGVPGQAIIGAASALAAVGATLPGLLWRARRTRQAIDDVHLGVALGPLWRSLQNHEPHDTAVTGGWRTPDVRLFRRVIEILDALDRVNTTYDPHGHLHAVAERVGKQFGLTTDDTDALRRAALVHYTTQHPISGHTGQPNRAAQAAPLTGPAEGDDFRKEARRLVRTTQYLVRSPLSARVARAVAPADHHERMNTMSNDHVDTPIAGCTCVAPSSQEAAWTEYAGGRAERDRFLADERARCPVHGAATHTGLSSAHN